MRSALILVTIGTIPKWALLQDLEIQAHAMENLDLHYFTTSVQPSIHRVVRNDVESSFRSWWRSATYAIYMGVIGLCCILPLLLSARLLKQPDSEGVLPGDVSDGFYALRVSRERAYPLFWSSCSGYCRGL